MEEIARVSCIMWASVCRASCLLGIRARIREERSGHTDRQTYTRHSDTSRGEDWRHDGAYAIHQDYPPPPNSMSTSFSASAKQEEMAKGKRKGNVCTSKGRKWKTPRSPDSVDKGGQGRKGTHSPMKYDGK